MGMKVMKLPISFGGAAKSSAAADDKNFFKTLNSVYFDSDFTTNVKVFDDEDEDEDDVEVIIRGAHSESSRLFFEPSTAKSISSNEPDDRSLDCVALTVESADPYEDFRRSMEEMATALVNKGDWGCLEELLAWYLSVNDNNNHAYIVAAFVDLLLKLSDDENCNLNEGFVSCSSSRRTSSSCGSTRELVQIGKSSCASCFSSSSSPSS